MPNVRRSTRVSTKPSYLDDYILLAEVECEKLLMIINNEPWDYSEAKKLQVWVDACIDELSSIEKNNTWVLIDCPKGFKLYRIEVGVQDKKECRWKHQQVQRTPSS